MLGGSAARNSGFTWLTAPADPLLADSNVCCLMRCNLQYRDVVAVLRMVGYYFESRYLPKLFSDNFFSHVVG